MDSFDKKMKHLFEEGAQDLPKGFTWDENADDIYTKMNQQQKNRKGLWFLLGLLVVVLGAGLWFTLSGDGTTTSVVSTVDNTPLSSKDIVPNTKPNPTTKTEVEKTETTNKLTENNKENKGEAQSLKTEVTELKKATTQPIAHQRKSTPRNSPETKKGIRRHNSISTPASPIPTSGKGGNPVAENAQNKDWSNNINNHSKTRREIKEAVAQVYRGSEEAKVKFYIGLLDNKVHVLKSSVDLVILHPEYCSIPVLVDYGSPAITKKYTSVTLRGGTLLALGSYNGNDQRNSHSKWLPGYHTGLEYNIHTDKGWYFSLGYNHDFAVQYFELISNDSVEVKHEDVVTHRITNALTGSITDRRGEVVLLTNHYRNYQTYNTFRSHSFSFTAGKSLLRNGKWNMTAGLGGRYTFSRVSSGSTLDNFGEVLDYTSDDAIYNKSSVDFLGELGIGYSMSKKVDLTTYMRAHKSITNWSNEADISYRPMLVQLGVGLRYKL